MDRVDVAIVGAGVVGLSIAAHVARPDRSVLLVERHESFGREASSRNSEVIHASIYYPPDSLKGTLCRRGNELMYALCRRHDIPHRNMGKLVVAVTEEEAASLPALLEVARGNGAAGVRLVDGGEARRLDPNVRCVGAMHCPSSGVVDSHALMQHFRAVALNAGAAEAYGVTLRSLERVADGFRLGVEERTGTRFEFEARAVVNAAGMGAGEVAALAGIDQDEAHYRIHYRKGMYFRVMRGIDKLPSMLVYPVPPQDATVGIHTCPDLAGGMRLGPHDTWVDSVDYTVPEDLGDLFFEAVKPFLPSLDRGDIQADMAGIQSKRFGPGEPSRDFVIRDEADRGLPGLIDLIGIESPGLTSSPAIGEMVSGLVEDALAR
jgi:L-2-hydroxyglutarate oxidase LhgO